MTEGPSSLFGPGIQTPETDPDYWLKVAQSVVRKFCGWHVAPVYTETLIVDGSGGHTLLLPTMHLTELVSVIVDGEDITEHMKMNVSRDGMLEFPQRLPTRLGSVQVTMTHGYSVEEAPEVVALIHTIAERVKTSSSNVISQSAGGMSVKYGTNDTGNLPGADLMATERALLNQYVVVWSVGA